MLTWTYREKSFSVGDQYNKLTVVRGPDGGVFFKKDDLEFQVDEDDIKEVHFLEPKLFKMGGVFLIDEDGEILRYVVDGREIELFVPVTNKEKKTGDFYLIFSIFKENDFPVKAM